MAPEYGATCGFFPVDDATLVYMRLTGRTDEQVALVEAYSKAQGMWRDVASADPVFTDSLSLDMGTVQPSLDTYMNVVRNDGGSIDSIDIWGRRRLAYEIDKNAEGIYAVVSLQAEPATVKELDRQLTLNESVLRTKVLRPDIR